MNILCIGGTRFLGKHILRQLLEKKHSVSVFNRGHHNDHLPQGTKFYLGDRNQADDFLQLGNQKYDAVIDTCAYLPKQAEIAAQFFQERCECYLFISTISVYRDFDCDEITEEYPLAEWNGDWDKAVDNHIYGPYKAICEKIIANAFGRKSLIVRPGYIVGPDDYTDRFLYWPWRISRDKTMIVPDQDCLMQFIDVRDLSAFCIHLLEQKKNGIYNVTGPKEKLYFRHFLEICLQTLHSSTVFQKCPLEILKQHGLLWNFPLWEPALPELRGSSQVNLSKALKEQLAFRPLAQTILDSLDWHNSSRAKDYRIKTGLTEEQEKQCLSSLEISQ